MIFFVQYVAKMSDITTSVEAVRGYHDFTVTIVASGRLKYFIILYTKLYNVSINCMKWYFVYNAVGEYTLMVDFPVLKQLNTIAISSSWVTRYTKRLNKMCKSLRLQLIVIALMRVKKRILERWLRCSAKINKSSISYGALKQRAMTKRVLFGQEVRRGSAVRK